jgi:hypothetical protein
MARTHSSDGVFTVQQVQEVPADGVVVGLHLDAPAVVRVVVPVQQHGAEAGHQSVADVARRGHGHAVLFRLQGAEHGAAGAQHVHRVRRRRQLFQRRLERRRQPAQGLELFLVGGELGGVGSRSWISRCAISSNSA